MFEEITIDGLEVEGDGTAVDGECFVSGNCDVVGAFRRGVCENPAYQYNQQLCELLSVWNTDEEFCVGWRYADSEGSTTVPLMGKEGSMQEDGEYPNTYYYMHQGEIPYIKVYDASSGSILGLIPSSELPGWELNIIEVIEGTSIASNTSAYQNCISLHAGANLISFYVLPDDELVENVLSSLGDNAIGIVGEGVAASFDGWEWSGSVTTIDETSGYWVIISEADELCILGSPVIGSEVEFNLNSGANLVSYPYEDSNEIESALTEDAQANLSGIIGEGVAASQADGEWNGSLIMFGKNEGYWLISNTAFDMHYNEPVGFSRQSSRTQITNYNQSIKQAFYFIESIENIEKGDIIHSYHNGINIGSRVWSGSFTDIPVMGDDGSLFTAGYCTEGSLPIFKVEKANGRFITLTGDIPKWSNNQLFMVGHLAESIELPAVYSLSTAYPNPFNPTTTFNFTIPAISNVMLEIYDVNGRIISILINSYMDAGYHSVVWDASSYASGVYFVKMIAGEFIYTQKLMLIK